MLAVSVASLVLATGAQAQGAAPAKGDPVEVKATGTPGKAAARQTVHVTATVTAVDAAARTVTLKNAAGETETFKVGPEVKRFSEIAPGDVLAVDYQVGLALEFQPPGTAVVPPTATASGARAEKDQAPGATASAGLTGTVTVTKIDMATRFVSLEGPNGNSFQVKAGPKVQLEKLKVGDKLLATYTESVAVKLEKAKKKK
jgi:Cu/Ag efflux protein CusF